MVQAPVGFRGPRRTSDDHGFSRRAVIFWRGNRQGGTVFDTVLISVPDPDIHMFLGHKDPDPDPFVRGMDQDPDPSIIKQNIKTNLDFYSFVTSF